MAVAKATKGQREAKSMFPKTSSLATSETQNTIIDTYIRCTYGASKSIYSNYVWRQV